MNSQHNICVSNIQCKKFNDASFPIVFDFVLVPNNTFAITHVIMPTQLLLPQPVGTYNKHDGALAEHQKLYCLQRRNIANMDRSVP